METKKYKKELELAAENLKDQKLILPSPHKLKVREEDLKIFFESNDEKLILKEWDFECFSDLKTYEKELKLGEFRD